MNVICFRIIRSFAPDEVGLVGYTEIHVLRTGGRLIGVDASGDVLRQLVPPRERGRSKR